MLKLNMLRLLSLFRQGLKISNKTDSWEGATTPSAPFKYATGPGCTSVNESSVALASLTASLDANSSYIIIL